MSTLCVYTHGRRGEGGGGLGDVVPELDNICPLLSISDLFLCGVRGNRHVERG